MSSSEKQLLTRIKKNEKISKPIFDLLYKKEKLEFKDAEFLYSIALSLIDEYEKNIKLGKNKKLFIEYAYFIIFKTSIKLEQYGALYDFTVNFGYYPVARKILELGLISNISINHILSNLEMDEYSSDNKTLTYEQNKIFKDVLNDENNSVSFIAPTSYGKSELIFSHINKFNDKNFIGIIVPTKALIDQVYREAKKRIFDRKIIIHDQNFNFESDRRILTVVTQERALRLIDEGLIFDILYIDEAHEMLQFDFRNGLNNRSLLLTRLINITRKKNSLLKEVYLSPVIDETNNLKINKLDNIQEHKIFNDLKILDINYLNCGNQHFKYDKFLGEFISINTSQNIPSYIRKNSKCKNLHFLYRPIFIERYVEDLYNILPEIKENEIPIEILNLIEELKEIVHPKFKMTKYLEKGIIYLHGKIPQIIKNYLLMFVRKCDFITHFAANSVILAGMNLPIDNLFYISGYSNTKDLYNLIGRVNRLNEIFSSENNELNRIIIPLHFVEIEKFPQNSNGNLKNKVENLRGSYKDTVRNPLLENAHVNLPNKENAIEIIKVENNLLKTLSNPDFLSKLIKGGAQQLLRFSDSGLIKLKNKIQNYQRTTVNNNLLDEVQSLFFMDFDEEDFNPLFNVKRLEHIETIKYYKKFIYELNKYSLSTRINNLVSYWQLRVFKDPLIYIGSQFGEVTRETENYQNPNKVYINLNEHLNNDEYIYNIAMIKLQIDEEFIGHEISLLLNTLLEFNIIDQIEFDEFFYGTNKTDELNILRLGISRNIFRKLKSENMIQNIKFDKYGNIKSNNELITYINTKSGIEKFELEQFFL